jgi:hypothetical protein
MQHAQRAAAFRDEETPRRRAVEPMRELGSREVAAQGTQRFDGP